MTFISAVTEWPASALLPASGFRRPLVPQKPMSRLLPKRPGFATLQRSHSD